jgi:hypothetical protein
MAPSPPIPRKTLFLKRLDDSAGVRWLAISGQIRNSSKNVADFSDHARADIRGNLWLLDASDA